MESMVIIIVIVVAMLFALVGLLALSIYLYFIYRKQKQLWIDDGQKWQQQNADLKTTLDKSEREKFEIKTKFELETRSLGEKLERITNDNAELRSNLEKVKTALEQETREKTDLLAKRDSESRALATRLDIAKTHSTISSADLEQIVKSISGISDVSVDRDDDVNFKFRDKDRDLMSIFIKGAGSERLAAVMAFPMPDDFLFMSVLASNNWNQRNDTHGTFAYTVKHNDKNIILLEADLNLRGGTSSDNIKAWVEGFINKINLFEECIVSDMKSLDIKDSQIGTGGGGSDFWGNVGAFAGELLKRLG